MTKTDLEKLLEKFAIAVIHTNMSNLSVEEQYGVIANGIEMIAETVMICTESKRNLSPSLN